MPVFEVIVVILIATTSNAEIRKNFCQRTPSVFPTAVPAKDVINTIVPSNFGAKHFIVKLKTMTHYDLLPDKSDYVLRPLKITSVKDVF